jgi:hypothetical protein
MSLEAQAARFALGDMAGLFDASGVFSDTQFHVAFSYNTGY